MPCKALQIGKLDVILNHLEVAAYNLPFLPGQEPQIRTWL